MEDILVKILVPIIVAILTALGGWFIRQIVKYKSLIKQQEDTNVLNAFNSALDEKLEPIQTDISNMKSDISNMKTDIGSLQKFETNFSTRLQPTQEEIEHLKDDITEILKRLKSGEEQLKITADKEKHLEHETRCAWRYRIRTLCHVYIQRGWMSSDEADQLREMFYLYESIGGNGQTKELYQKTAKTVKTLSDAEVAEKLAK